MGCPWRRRYAAHVADGREPKASGADKYEYYVAVRNHLERATQRQPLLLVIEDLHLADDASTQLLQFLADGARKFPLLLVATCRTPLAPDREHVVAALARHARAVTLGPLSDEGSRRLFRALVGSRPAPAEETQALALAAGNPLFLREVAFGVRTNPGWTAKMLLATATSAVHESIRWHLSTLAPSTERVLRAAAIAGEEFDTRLLSSVLDSTTPSVLKELAPAVRQEVVKPVSELDFRFTHALLRQHLYETTPELERRELHWALGISLVRGERHHSEEGQSRVAHHLAEGAVSGDQIRQAVEFARKAVDACFRRFAFRTAASEYRRTSRLAEGAGIDARARVLLLVRASECLRFGGHTREAQQAASEAAELARAHADPIA